LEFKEYSSDDLDKIILLFDKVFNIKLNQDYWNWRFLKNPFGKPLIQLCWDNKQLVSVYLVHPLSLEIDKTVTKSLFSMFTMTDQNYSGKGIMTKLANQIFDRAKKNHFSSIMGFANENSRYLFIKKLNFKEITIMKECIIRVPENITESSNLCTKITKFNDSFSVFYNDLRNEIPSIKIPRTSRFLNWRYIEHPTNLYQCYKIESDEKILGYFILKNYDGKKGHIIDFLLIDDCNVFDMMICQAMKFCKINKLPILTFWLNQSTPIYRCLKKYKFYENPMDVFLVFKSLNDEPKDIANIDNWYLTMGDSDVF